MFSPNASVSGAIFAVVCGQGGCAFTKWIADAVADVVVYACVVATLTLGDLGTVSIRLDGSRVARRAFPAVFAALSKAGATFRRRIIINRRIAGLAGTLRV